MASASNVAHRGLPFANPMREADVDRALASLALPPGALVLDTGCGSGEMLLRALERDATWRGLSRRSAVRPRTSSTPSAACARTSCPRASTSRRSPRRARPAGPRTRRRSRPTPSATADRRRPRTRRIRARQALPDGTRTLGFALLVLRAAGPRAGDG